MAEGAGRPTQVQPPPSPRWYSTRRDFPEPLREELNRDVHSGRHKPQFLRFPRLTSKIIGSPAIGGASSKTSATSDRSTLGTKPSWQIADSYSWGEVKRLPNVRLQCGTPAFASGAPDFVLAPLM